MQHPRAELRASGWISSLKPATSFFETFENIITEIWRNLLSRREDTNVCRGGETCSNSGFVVRERNGSYLGCVRNTLQDVVVFMIKMKYNIRSVSLPGDLNNSFYYRESKW